MLAFFLLNHKRKSMNYKGGSMQQQKQNALEHIGMQRIGIAGLIALLMALAGNLFLAMFTVSGFDTPESFQPLQASSVSLFTTIGVVGATVVFALLAWLRENPLPLYWTISAVVLLVSFIPNIIMLVNGTAAAAVISLMLMHVIAAVASVGSMTWLLRQKMQHYTAEMAYE